MGPTAYALNVFSHTRHVFTHADFFFTSHEAALTAMYIIPY